MKRREKKKGQMLQQIQIKTTEQVVKSKKKYSRKGKEKFNIKNHELE